MIKTIVLEKSRDKRVGITAKLRGAVSVIAVTFALGMMPASANEVKSINITQGSLESAIVALSNQVDGMVFISSNLTKNIMVRPLQGEMSFEEALVYLLADTGLGFMQNEDGSYVIVKKSGFQRISYDTSAEYESNFGVYEEDAGSREEAHAVLDEVTVTGSRRKARSPSDTPSPVDVILASDFRNQGGGDMMNLIRNIVPSFNATTQPISDASTLIRPANLRGLPPDNTLVLVNGKRRHRAAVISWVGNGVSDGAHGPDVSTIPSIALKQVEVLRDGAAAQYGSDAIAGVINFILDDSPDGGSVEAKYGQTYEGDGASWQLSGTIGTTLGNNGFIRGSVEYREADPTSRSVQRNDALGLIAAGNTDVEQPFAQVWGSPRVLNDFKSFINFAVEAGDNMEFYGFGNYAEREVEGGFYYRNPNTRGGVFSQDGGTTRLVGDMTPDDGITCTGGVNFATGVIDNPLVVGSAGEDAALATILADPNCFVFNEIFPGGFTPSFGGTVNDIAGVFGLRGEFQNGITYDVSLAAGRNEANFIISDTVNPSMGSNTPTTFELGSYVELEKTFSVDLSYPLEIDGLASPLNIAGGFEWREEQFSIGVGQSESFERGVLAQAFDATDGSGSFVQGFGIGSNGFAGFSPQIAGTNDRSNIAFYLDLETDVTDDLVLGFAVRYEDFSDFGSTTNFKASSLYHVTDEFTLRSTYSTGFRAPTVGQSNASNVSTNISNDTLELTQQGTIPSTHPVAVSQGGGQLQPEKSKSFSLGFAYSGEYLSVTVDYFNIKVRDRITLGTNITLSDEEKVALEASGITGASDFSSFKFFTNDFATRTQGIDIVANIPLDITDDGLTNISFAGNWTDTKVTDNSEGLLSDTRVRRIEDGVPAYRGNVTLNHSQGNWRGLIRTNYYGSYYEAHAGSSSRPIEAGDEITVDVEIALTVAEQYDFIVGANNILNNFPDINPYAADFGAKYPSMSPMGYNGGYYYVRVQYNF